MCCQTFDAGERFTYAVDEDSMCVVGGEGGISKEEDIFLLDHAITCKYGSTCICCVSVCAACALPGARHFGHDVVYEWSLCDSCDVHSCAGFSTYGRNVSTSESLLAPSAAELGANGTQRTFYIAGT